MNIYLENISSIADQLKRLTARPLFPCRCHEMLPVTVRFDYCTIKLFTTGKQASSLTRFLVGPGLFFM